MPNKYSEIHEILHSDHLHEDAVHINHVKLCYRQVGTMTDIADHI